MMLRWISDVPAEIVAPVGLQVLRHPRHPAEAVVVAAALEVDVERVDPLGLGGDARGALADLGAEQLEHRVLG